MLARTTQKGPFILQLRFLVTQSQGNCVDRQRGQGQNLFELQAAVHHSALLGNNMLLGPLAILPYLSPLSATPQPTLLYLPISIIPSLIEVALQTAGCHTLYFFAQAALHANAYCNESLICFKISKATLNFGLSLKLILDILLFPKVRMILQQGNALRGRRPMQTSLLSESATTVAPWARPLCLHPMSCAVGPHLSNPSRTSRQVSNQAATAVASGSAGLSADKDHQLYSTSDMQSLLSPVAVHVPITHTSHPHSCCYVSSSASLCHLFLHGATFFFLFILFEFHIMRPYIISPSTHIGLSLLQPPQ